MPRPTPRRSGAPAPVLALLGAIGADVGAVLVGGAGLAGCASAGAKMDALPKAVAAYNELLRWGKLDGAATFHLPEDQAAFVARYAAAEDDLHIESLEVRAVTFPRCEGEPPPLCADVTVVAQAYLLPSTVLAKTVMIQRWVHRDGAWRLVASDRELAPEVPSEPSRDPRQPPAEPGLDSPETAPDTGAGADGASAAPPGALLPLGLASSEGATG